MLKKYLQGKIRHSGVLTLFVGKVQGQGALPGYMGFDLYFSICGINVTDRMKAAVQYCAYFKRGYEVCFVLHEIISSPMQIFSTIFELP